MPSEVQKYETLVVENQKDLGKRWVSLESKQKENEEYLATIQELTAEIDTVTRDISETDNQLTQETETLSINQKKLDDTNKAIDVKRQEIGNNEWKIKGKDDKIKSLEGEITKLAESNGTEAQIATKRAEQARLRKDIEGLKAKNAELNRQKKELENLLPGIKRDIEWNNQKIEQLKLLRIEQKAKEEDLTNQREGVQSLSETLVAEIEKDTQDIVRISNELTKYHELYQENIQREAKENTSYNSRWKKEDAIAWLWKELEFLMPGLT